MRLNFAQPLIALSLLAPLLAGCLERGQPTMVDTSVDDDAFCRAKNVAPGSSEYIACRKDRDVQHANADARTDRRQRVRPMFRARRAVSGDRRRCRAFLRDDC